MKLLRIIITISLIHLFTITFVLAQGNLPEIVIPDAVAFGLPTPSANSAIDKPDEEKRAVAKFVAEKFAYPFEGILIDALHETTADTWETSAWIMEINPNKYDDFWSVQSRMREFLRSDGGIRNESWKKVDDSMYSLYTYTRDTNFGILILYELSKPSQLQLVIGWYRYYPY